MPIGRELGIEVTTDYAGRNAGHYSARLVAAGKEVARFTALMQRESAVALPDPLPGVPSALLRRRKISACDLSVRGPACRLC